MQKIKRDFVLRELFSLLCLMALMAACILYLILYTGITPGLLLFLPLLAAAFLLRMLRQAATSFQLCCGVRSESWQERMGEEYAAAHPVYKTAYGEIHLLESCLVCRCKRRLLFIPTDEILKVQARFRLVGARRIPVLKFTMESGKSPEVDFSARRPQDGQAVLSWLFCHLEEEKMVVSE